MSILIFAIIVIVVVALLVWAIDSAPVPSPVNWVLRVAVILIGALLIVNRAGLV